MKPMIKFKQQFTLVREHISFSRAVGKRTASLFSKNMNVYTTIAKTWICTGTTGQMTT